MRAIVRSVLLFTIISYVAAAYASVTVTVNGASHTIPQTNEKGWGNNVTAWIQAISANTLQPSGGAFTLTADTDFGSSFGLKSAYFSSRDASASTAGLVRLGNSDSIGWRNVADNGDLLLSVNGSNQLTFNGSTFLAGTSLTASRALVSDVSGNVTNSSVTTTEINRLSGVGSSVCGKDDTCTLTAKSIDAASNTITNIDNAAIKSAAAIAVNKLAAVTANRVLLSDASGFLSASSVTNTTLGFVDFTSSGQTQLGTKAPLASPTFTGTVTLPLSTAGLVTTTSGGVISSTATASIAQGGTGQATKAAAFDALSPMTTAGDIIYGGSSGTGTRLAVGTDGYGLVVASGAPSWVLLPQVAYVTFGGASESNNCTGSPCTIYRSSNASITVTRGGSGSYTINFPSGMFSNPMVCSGVAANNANGIAIMPNGTSTSTAFPLNTINTNTQGAVDAYARVHCTGPR